MSPILIGIIGISFLLVLIFIRVPIGASMAIVGFIGFAFVSGISPALGLLKQVPYDYFASYNLSIVPLFILMGAFAQTAGLSEDLYRVANKWLGNLKGGLAVATVGACAFFAAICGSSVATAATMATVSLPEMRKYKYDDALATGCIAAGGSMGILIPPSVVLIMYGIIAEQSIGKLFIAGFIPGILEALFYIITIIIIVNINPSLGPRGEKYTLKEKFKSLLKVWETILLFLIVIGGIYLGIFTPTEAAGIGAFGAFVFAVFRRRMKWLHFKNSLKNTVSTTGMVFMIVMGAMILGYFLTITRLPFDMAAAVSALPINRYVVLAIILAMLALLGCVMDSMAIVLLTAPIFLPVIYKMNFNPIWFGILMVRVTEMGLITPPVGLNVYIIHGISKVPMGIIFRGIAPFLLADVLEIVLLVSIPGIALFLPAMMNF